MRRLIDPFRRLVEVFEEGRDGVELPSDGVASSASIPEFSLPIAELWGSGMNSRLAAANADPIRSEAPQPDGLWNPLRQRKHPLERDE